MRYSMIKAAAVALFGLSNVLIGVNASPVGDYDVQDSSVTYDTTLVARTKPVPKLEDHKYVVTAGPCLKNKPCLYKITKPDVQGEIDLIKIDPAGASITVEDANNKDDKSADKLHLSDIEMSLFVYKGEKKASDLKILSAKPVVNAATRSAIVAGYEKLGLKDKSEYTVKASGTGHEKEVFNSLMNTPFGKNAAFLVKDFGTKPVSSIHVSDGKVQPTLSFHFE